MKILVYTPLFPPSVGGLEKMMSGLASGFHERGEEVKVVCNTESGGTNDNPDFEVVRRPAAAHLLNLTRWCDVFLQGCVSLRGLWPLLLAPGKRYVVTHQTWYVEPGRTSTLAGRVKQLAARWADVNISCSRAIADALGAPSHVIPNSFDDATFRRLDNVPRERDLVFVGRLVSDKGADLLLEALSILRKSSGPQPSLTIIGAGPEEKSLREMTTRLELEGQVAFAGVRHGADLARSINAHRVLVAPSRWAEPFGIVALEGIACGCAVIGSKGGGLAEAIGPCGLTFANNDAAGLADCIQRLMAGGDELDAFRARADAHLEQYKHGAIVDRYLALIRAA